MSKEELHVVPEETLSSVDNPVFVTEKSRAAVMPDKKTQEVTSSTGSTDIIEYSDQSSFSATSNPPTYEEIEGGDEIEEIEVQNTLEEDERILKELKEIVKLTTASNPLKRPSEYQVVVMLEEVMPMHMRKSMDMFDISDDDDDDDDVNEDAKQI